MADEKTVPCLPCRSIDEIEEFYGALGFTRTHYQVRPNPYVALQPEDLHLHFFGIPDFDPADSYGSCLVIVPDTGDLTGPSPRACGPPTENSWSPASRE